MDVMGNFSLRSYQAVELHPAGPSIVQRPFPLEYRSNTTIVAPLLAGICRSDIKEVAGVRSTRSDFGHELVSTVLYADQATGLSNGATVSFNPNVRITRTSGFAEIMEAEGDPVLLSQAFPRLDATTSPKRSVFTEPLACAEHCICNVFLHLSRKDLTGLRIGVIGAGTMGTLIGLLVRYYGGDVHIINRSPDRLEYLALRKIFPRENLHLHHDEVAGCDVVIPTTTFLDPPVLTAAQQLVISDGLILLFGGTREGDQFPDTTLDIHTLRRQELSHTISSDRSARVSGTYSANFEDFRRASEVLSLAKSLMPVESLVAGEVSLANLPTELQRLANPQARYLGKTLVRLSDSSED